jgi:glycerophosphoryl diester phosphodiesterase
MRFPIGHAIAAAAHLDVRVLAVHGGSLWRNASNGSLDIPAVETVVAHVHEMKRQLLVWCPAKRRSSALVAAGVDAMVVDDLPYHLHRRDLRRHRPVTGRRQSSR